VSAQRCNWPVSDGQRCRREGTPFLAYLTVCWQHKNMLLDSIENAIRLPRDRHDEAVKEVAESALKGVAYANSLKRRAERQARSLVYFVERDGFVKIGYSCDLEKRIKAISAGSCMIEGMTVGPVRLLATIPGAGESNEQWLHHRFDHLRVGGEWFLLTDELESFIAGLKHARDAHTEFRSAA
jgi:T5orf172 domain.